MDHRDHVNLIRTGVPTPDGAQPAPIWADLGSGSGAFTLALRELLGPAAEIYSVDRDGARLREQARAMENMFPHSNVHYLQQDFSRSLSLPPLDGIVMANALHYTRDKVPVLKHMLGLLKPCGTLVLVEYNVDSGNPWVPHPLSFETFRDLALRAGFGEPRLLATVPSRFLREFYAAAAARPW